LQVATREIRLEFQPYFDFPARQVGNLYGQACSNDAVTVNAWRPTWLKNVKANKVKFGSFAEHGVGKLFGAHRYKPVVLAGSGPSLKFNGPGLAKRDGLPLVSCLHNFHYLEDLGTPADYYVTLDAGPVTIEEVSEGGTKSADEYWALTKERTLIAYIGTDPELLERWQGKVYFFNCPLPDERLMNELEEVERFRTFLSTGGNVLGAATYFAKGILGASALVYVGADFSFSYTDKFHGWDSKYDADIGHCIRLTDVFGNKVKTWQSYANFKAWFDWLVEHVPGVYINATEGGCFGSYPEGNIRGIRQMTLEGALRMFQMSDELRDQCENPGTEARKILF
jgi:hypothetical protein